MNMYGTTMLGFGAANKAPWGITKKATEEYVTEQISTALTQASTQTDAAIEAAKAAISIERDTEIEAALTQFASELNVRISEIENAFSEEVRETALARAKMVLSRDFEIQKAKEEILSSRAIALEIAAKDSELARRQLKTTVLMEREAAIKSVAAEAKLAREILLKDIMANLASSIEILRVEQKDIIASVKANFSKDMAAATNAREALEIRRQAALAEAQVKQFAMQEVALTSLYRRIKTEHSKYSKEASRYVDNAIVTIKGFVNDIATKLRSEVTTERDKAIEVTRLQEMTAREEGLQAAKAERTRLEKVIDVLEKERQDKIRRELAARTKQQAALQASRHPLARFFIREGA